MKTKYVIGIFLILLIAATACVYAAEATVDEYKFTIPDGFKIAENGDDIVTLQSTNDTRMMGVGIHKNSKIGDEAISNKLDDLEGRYNVTGNKTFQYEGKDIYEINYKTTDVQFKLYHWQMGDDWVAVTFAYPAEDDEIQWDDSPAKTVCDTLCEK